jgi:hypothetical protein
LPASETLKAPSPERSISSPQPNTKAREPSAVAEQKAIELTAMPAPQTTTSGTRRTNDVCIIE